MIEEPKTIDEKIQFLKERAPYVTLRTGLTIYGQAGNLCVNYYLCSDGKISVRGWGGRRVKERIEIEDFARIFGEKGLKYAIKWVKLKVRIPKESP